MGLDVSHLQLTLTPNDNGNFFYVDEWDLECNVPIEHYSQYITTIDDFDFNKSLVIVKNEEEHEKLKGTDWFNATDCLKVFIGEINDTMKEQLAKFIIKHKLDKLRTSQLGCTIDGIKFHSISFGEPVKVQGVYFQDDIGYQRKGMSNLFYDTFKKYTIWGKKEDFELAYSCVGGGWYLENWGEKSVDEMRRNFKENFIDNFEFGKSLLCASF